MLERIVQAAATCCASTGGVGLLLLNHDEQLRYVAAAGRPRRSLAAGIRAWLSVPVRQRHGPIGVLDFACSDPRPWPPQDLAAANGFARLIVATPQPATAAQQEALSPALRFAAEHDARIERARGVIMERERLNEVAAVELLRLQAQIEGQPIRAVAERLLSRPRR